MPPELNELSATGDLADQVVSQLRMIEVSHDVTIVNLANVAKIIMANINSKTEALKVCTAINTWIAINGLQGSVVVPEPLVRKYVKKVIGQRQ